MEGGLARTLALHGAIVLLLGILSGLPFWFSILRDRKESFRPWQVAHATLITAGLMMLLIAHTAPDLALGNTLRRWLTGSLVASGYGFSFALIVGAAAGIRGLDPRPLGMTTVFFVGHLVGAAGSTIGAVILLIGLL